MRVLVPITSDMIPGDRLEVFGSFDVLTYADTERINGHAIPIFPEWMGNWGSPGGPGGLRDRYLIDSMYGVPVPQGSVYDAPLYDEPLYGERSIIAIDVENVRGFGAYNVGVKVADRLGQKLGSTVEVSETVVDPPLGLASFAFASYDSANDRLTFSCTHLALL